MLRTSVACKSEELYSITNHRFYLSNFRVFIGVILALMLISTTYDVCLRKRFKGLILYTLYTKIIAFFC